MSSGQECWRNLSRLVATATAMSCALPRRHCSPTNASHGRCAAGWRRSSHLRSDGRDGSLNPSSTSINRERFAMTRFMRVPFSERRQTDSECGDA